MVLKQIVLIPNKCRMVLIKIILVTSHKSIIFLPKLQHKPMMDTRDYNQDSIESRHSVLCGQGIKGVTGYIRVSFLRFKPYQLLYCLLVDHQWVVKLDVTLHNRRCNWPQ